MTDRGDLLKAVELGIEAESFLESKLGRFLIERAEAELKQAEAGLKTVFAEDAKAIRNLQNMAWRAESVQTWLAEVIQSGWGAEEMLKNEDGE